VEGTYEITTEPRKDIPACTVTLTSRQNALLPGLALLVV
jgi:hypothetical protein